MCLLEVFTDGYFSGCLCSWLEQDVSCPTCRRSLAVDVGIPQGVQEQAQPDDINAEDLQEIAAENRNENAGAGLRNYFFYLDGQQIANWFPSFSIEVFHGRVDNQQLEEMVSKPVVLSYIFAFCFPFLCVTLY